MTDDHALPESDSTAQLARYRLPRTVIPSNYELRIVPNLEAGTFSGTVRIAVDVTDTVKEFVLNSDELTITAATVDAQDVDFALDPELERLTLRVDKAPGTALIDIAFAGSFNPQLVGFYQSSFSDAEGNPKTIATTQFESTYARKAFPCWDEPDLKATFDITVVAPAGANAIANSAETGRTTSEDGTVITFATTMVMSTYLVAFVIGDIEMTDAVKADGVNLRVVHVRGAGQRTLKNARPLLTGDEAGTEADQGGAEPSAEETTVDLTAFAIECGQFAMKYFSDYFDTPYPGDKIDLVAVPDFAMGAMENLGCVTFRESLLLVDPSTSTQPELQRVADVIFHELAHMWFGDLVTMKWWNGLWLNEAFATFMEMRCTDAFRPQWQRWVDFGSSRTAAFDVDALSSTRPIEFEVISPDDAEGMFDVLTYEKGAAVVRMLEQHIGESVFRSGLRRYMAQHAYSNTETTDLWDAIEAECDQPVRAIMDSWIFQGGVPVVYTELAPNGRSVTFSQERLSYAGTDNLDEEQAAQLWKAPLRYRWKPVGGEPVTGRVLLEDETTVIELDQEAEWLVANAEGASYLRVFYEQEALDTLGAVAFDALAPVERYALVDDAWASVLAGSTTGSTFLSLLESLTAETDRSVWSRMLAGFASIGRLLSGEAKANFEALVHDAIVPALAGLTLSPQEDDDDRSRQLRGDLIRAMGTTANDDEIQDEAQRAASEGRRDSSVVEASILSAAIDVTAATGDDVDLEDFLEAFATASTPQEQLRFLYATADFPEFEQLKKVFEMILAGQVRAQNAPFWLSRALSNQRNGSQMWVLISNHWQEIQELVPTSSLVRLLSGVASLTSPGQADQVGAFFAEHPIPQGAKTLSQILERQRVGTALRNAQAATLNSILA